MRVIKYMEFLDTALFYSKENAVFVNPHSDQFLYFDHSHIYKYIFFYRKKKSMDIPPFIKIVFLGNPVNKLIVNYLYYTLTHIYVWTNTNVYIFG